MKQTIELETLTRYTHYDHEIESAVLGAILIEKNCLVNILNLLFEDIFYMKENKLIYRTLVWMWNKGWDIDILTLNSFIYKHGISKWEEITGEHLPVYITKLTNAVVSTANIETHCIIIRQLYVARLLWEAKHSDGYTMDHALDTKKKIDDAFNIGAVDSWQSIEEVINKKLIKKMNDRSGQNIIETSFQKLNNFSPVESGDYVIIGARPSIGKTAIAMQMACDIASKGNSVGVISLETKGEKLAARMLAAQTKIEFWRIWKNNLSEHQTQSFYNSASQISTYPVFIYDKPTVNHLDIRIAANKLRRKTTGNLVLFIDYIQLVAPEEKTRLDRRLQINEISRTIKLICMELENTAVIVLAQLTRDASKEPPRMHHLKESGALEQDAEKIWLLHRDRDKEEEDKAQGLKVFDAKMFIEKNKEGWTGEIDLLFDAESMSFKEKGQEFKQFIPETNQFNDDNPF